MEVPVEFTARIHDEEGYFEIGPHPDSSEFTIIRYFEGEEEMKYLSLTNECALALSDAILRLQRLNVKEK